MATMIGWTRAAGWLGAEPTTGCLVPLPGVRSTAPVATGVPARTSLDADLGVPYFEPALPPLMIEVTPMQIADPEAFAREIQAGIMRWLSSEDRVPYVISGEELLAKHGWRPAVEAVDAIERDARKAGSL